MRPARRAALAGTRAQLVCLPFAGAGFNAYWELIDALPLDVDVLAASLPGRERRLGEALATNWLETVGMLQVQLEPLLTPPYALFGHGMGAVLAFDLARRLLHSKAPAPGLLLVSGALVPDASGRADPDADLSDAELSAKLRRLGGLYDEPRANDELQQLLLPPFRADLRLLSQFRMGTDVADCPMVVYGGQEDADALQGWGRHTRGPCRVRLFPGGHFFYLEQLDEFARVLARDLLDQLEQPHKG